MAPSTQEIPGIEMPEFNRLAAYWILSPGVWLSLATVWLVVALSVVTSFEIPSSGAVLVGGALVSEMLFEQLRWRKLPCPPEGTFYLVPDSNTRNPIAQNQFYIAPVGSGKLGALLSLTREDQIKVNNVRNEITWYYRDVVDRIEKVLFYSIVFTAILGTLLWGYGHRIFE